MEGFINMLERIYADDEVKQAKVVVQLHQCRSMQGLFGPLQPQLLQAECQLMLGGTHTAPAILSFKRWLL